MQLYMQQIQSRGRNVGMESRLKAAALFKSPGGDRLCIARLSSSLSTLMRHQLVGCFAEPNDVSCFINHVNSRRAESCLRFISVEILGTNCTFFFYGLVLPVKQDHLVFDTLLVRSPPPSQICRDHREDQESNAQLKGQRLGAIKQSTLRRQKMKSKNRQRSR